MSILICLHSVCGLELWNGVLRVFHVCPIILKAATQGAARKANSQKRKANTVPAVADSNKKKARIAEEENAGSNDQSQLIANVRDKLPGCISF